MTKQTSIAKSRLLSLTEEVPAAPLVVFRIAFGVMMFLSMVRFAAKGWIETLYIQPQFFFTFYGFEWVKPLSAEGMYVVFGLMMVAALFIALGAFYRISALVFFLLFTYVELIDKTNYLNHYYFISIISGIMCLLPANKFFSVDAKLGWTKASSVVPRWTILSLQLQLAIVYFFAGIAKINADWLLQAMPLKIWLPVRYNVPLIGQFLNEEWIAYLFSWAGMLFDVTIAFFLFTKRTTWYAYAVVIIFHVMTAILFPMIGMFPFIMVVCATIFLPAAFHQKLLQPFSSLSFKNTPSPSGKFRTASIAIISVLVIHFSIQILLPLRYTLYPGPLFYTEEGYRFSWRVMLMEKAGYVSFVVRDAQTGKMEAVHNRDYLTMQQEKQMSTQPDMILQFAHHLKEVYAAKMSQPEIHAEAYVSLNGRKSQLFVGQGINLAAQQEDFSHKKWILAKAD